MTKKEDQLLGDLAKLLAVDMHESIAGRQRLDELNHDLDQATEKSDNLLNDLDDLMNTELRQLDESQLGQEDITGLLQILDSTVEMKDHSYAALDTFDGTDIEGYAERNDLDLGNPYTASMSNYEFSTFSKNMVDKFGISQLDKYDYGFASVLGIIMGLVDAFFVGSITDGNNNKTREEQGALSKKVDASYEKIIQKFGIDNKKKELLANKNRYVKSQLEKGLNPSSKKLAQFDGWIEEAKKADPKKAIGYLEKFYKVNYDAANGAHILEGSVAGMNPSNHHLLSLSHDSGIMGLVFGVVDQLTGKATMIDKNGSIVRVVTDNASSLTNEGSLPKRIIDAIVNWFGHTMSDIAGASGSVGRGAGLPGPFYVITQTLQFGNFTINGQDGKSVADVSEGIYKQGLDMRALTAQAIPVIITEVLIRLYWAFKQHFYYGDSWKDSMPIGNKPDLARMLLVAMATFETVDIADAIIRNGPSVNALLRINFVGVIDLGFRSVQVVRNHYKHEKMVQNIIDNDIQDEWDRILAN